MTRATDMCVPCGCLTVHVGCTAWEGVGVYPKPVAEIQGVGAGHLEVVGTPNHSEQKLLHLELAIHIRAVVVDEVDPGWFAGSGLICSLLEILRETSLNEASEPGEFHLDLNDHRSTTSFELRYRLAMPQHRRA